MHRRTGAPVVPMFTYWDGERSVVVIEKPLDDRFNGDLEEDLRLVNSWMEGVIREHPESWFWFHRRWKRARRKDGEDKGEG